MGYTFTKLFSGLTESTVWVEPYPTRILWVSMLSWADQQGRIFGSVPGIARRAGINLDEAEAALVSFMSPDRHSRTPDNDGRRIEKIDGGWRLLNYGKYREMRDAETRREQNREAQRRHRERLAMGCDQAGISGGQVSQQVSKTADKPDNKPASAQAEAEADKETLAGLSDKPVDKSRHGINGQAPDGAKGGKPPRAKARANWIDEKAAELGLKANPGESWEAFARRVKEMA